MARRLGPTPNLPNVSEDARDSLEQLNRALWQELTHISDRAMEVLPKDGTEPMIAPLPFAIFVNAAALPSAALWEGAVAYLTDENLLVMSDGTTWHRIRVNQGALALLPAFRAHKNGTNQTGIGAGAFTTITFGTETYDQGGFFASDTWTPPAGLVHLSGAFQSSSTPAGFPAADPIYCAIFKNGNEFARGGSVASVGVNSGNAQVDTHDRANGSDAYTLRAFFTSVGAASTATIAGGSTLTYFTGAWLDF